MSLSFVVSVCPLYLNRRCLLLQLGFINGPGQTLIPLVRAAGAPSPYTMSVCACSASYLRRWLLTALLLLAAASPPKSGDCPGSCACYVPTEVHCTFRYLTAIPDHIQPAVERINLGWAFGFLRSSEQVWQLQILWGGMIPSEWFKPQTCISRNNITEKIMLATAFYRV